MTAHVLVVLHQDGHDVVLARTSLAEPMRQPVRRDANSSKLMTVPDGLQDDGGLIGAMRANLHAPRVRRGPATRAAGRRIPPSPAEIVCKLHVATLLVNPQASVKTGLSYVDGLKLWRSVAVLHAHGAPRNDVDQGTCA